MVSDRHQLRVLQRAMKGDAVAFAGLCYRYADALYRYLYFRLGSVFTAEEVCAQVFVRAWEQLPSDPRHSVMPFAAWLFLVANDVVLERNEQFAQAGLHPSRPPMVSWSDHSGGTRRLRLHPRHLAQAIMQLDDVSQQVILLRFVLRMSHRDTGLIIGDTGAGSRVLQYRSLLEVRERLTRKKMSEHAYASDYVGAATFCLDRIVAGRWSAQDCLEHLPAEGERLTPVFEFAMMVREASMIRPRQSFEDDLQKQLTRDLRNSRRRPVHQPKFWRWFLSISERVPTPIVASFLLGLILVVGIVGSSSVAMAVNAAAPGDRLYDLDLRLEQAYKAFLTDPHSRMQFMLDVTEERLAEAERLAQRGDTGGLQVALVAYSAEVAALAADDASQNSAVTSIDVDRHFSQQQQRLDTILVTALESSSASSGSETPVVTCDQPEMEAAGAAMHPLGLTLASQHGVHYREVINWVCSGHSFGEIVLALATVDTDQVSTAEVLALKSQLGGWGQLWHEIQVNGKPSPAGNVGRRPTATEPLLSTGTAPAPTPEIMSTPVMTATVEQTRDSDETDVADEDATREPGPPAGAGPPDHAGPPENAGPPTEAGPPDHAGPPEGAGPPEDTGPPDHAGPPEGAGPPEDTGPPDHAGPPDNDGNPGNDNNPGNGGGRPGG